MYGLYGKYYVYKIVSNCFLKWLYLFVFLPVKFESSSCSTSLPVFDIISFYFIFRFLIILISV